MKNNQKTKDQLIIELEQLQLYKDEFKNILQATQVGTWEWDIQTDELTFSDRWTELVGYSLEELKPLTAKKWGTFTHPDDLSKSRKLIKSHLTGKTPNYDLEYRMKHKDGHWVWVHNHGKVVSWSAQGEPLLMYGTYTDISNKKLAEQNMSDNTKILKESLNEIIIFDAKTYKFLQCNSGALKNLGYTQEELMHLTPYDIKDTFTKESFIEHLQPLVTGEKKILEFETIHRRKDGSLYDVESHLQLSEFNGRRAFVAIVLDITKRKETEKLLQQYFEIIDRGPAVAFTWRNEENLPVEFVSENVEKLFGYSAEEFMSGKAVYADIIHPDDVNIVFNEVQKFSNEVDKKDFIHKPYRIITKAKQVRWVDDRTSVIRAKNGVITHYQGIVLDITNRMLAEEAFKKSEEKFLLISDYMYDWEYFINPDGRLKYLSPSCERITGYSQDEFMSNPNLISKIVKKDYSKKFDSHRHIELIEDNTDTSIRLIEFPIITKEGKERWIEHNCMSVFDDDNRYIGVRVNNRDITERKLAEEALTESEERFRNITESMSDWIWEVDSNGVYTYVSSNVQSILGYTSEEIIGKTPFEFMTSKETERVGTIFQEIVTNKKPIQDLENWNRCKDGRLVCLLTNGIPLLDQQGKLLGYRGVDKDITERKHAEKKNALLSKAIEQSSESIVITDANARIQYVNPAFEKITGYTASEAIGKNPRLLKSGQHDIVFYKDMWEILSKGEQWHGEIINKKKDGTFFTENTVISAIFDSQGEITNYVAVKTDITETNRLQELESRAKRLEMAGILAGQVAHDFNNLLGPIIAYPEIIRRKLPPDHKAIKQLDIIEKSGKQLAEINQDLLTMGRRGHYKQKVLNLNEVVQFAVNEIKSRTMTVVCKENLCDELMNIKGGAAQIHRILMNLLVNACDALNDIGEITIMTENYYADDTTIAFGLVPKGEYVKLTIADNGCGIPEDIIQKILDPFFSTKDTNTKSGSGLGLSVVDAVMKDHKGFLDLKSEIDVGTTFYLYFPVSRVKVKGDEDTIQLKGGKEKILIVDDDVIQQKISASLLKKLGYHVSVVESGEKAVAFLRNNYCDLVLLDMIMPGGIDGIETYKQILETNPHQKAIIVSGLSESSTIQEAMDLGVGDFVQKPITKKSISSAVREELNRTLQTTPA